MYIQAYQSTNEIGYKHLKKHLIVLASCFHWQSFSLKMNTKDIVYWKGHAKVIWRG